MIKTVVKLGMAAAFLMSSLAIASAQAPNKMEKQNPHMKPEKNAPGGHATGGGAGTGTGSSGNGGSAGSGGAGAGAGGAGGAGAGGGGGSGGGR